MNDDSIRKTYKLFIGGKFPRSESGRSYQPAACPQRNVPLGSRKDLRDAVVAARGALEGWAGLTGYNRGQILYRLAELLQSHAASLAGELTECGATWQDARMEVEAAVGVVFWYAGLPDKLQTLLGSQNGVSGPFFNFSTVEPTGVVAIAAPQQPGLIGAISLLAPVLAGGNTAVVLVSEVAPLPALTLGEVLAVSDFPGGVVNLLSGRVEELRPQMASHRDVDALFFAGEPDPAVGQAASDSVKRVRWTDFGEDEREDAAAVVRRWEIARLAWVEPFVETKTLWHPVAY